MADETLTPSTALLCKLGSIARHVQEATDREGHWMDLAAVETLIADPEVQGWMQGMDRLALLPVARRGGRE